MNDLIENGNEGIQSLFKQSLLILISYRQSIKQTVHLQLNSFVIYLISHSKLVYKLNHQCISKQFQITIWMISRNAIYNQFLVLQVKKAYLLTQIKITNSKMDHPIFNDSPLIQLDEESATFLEYIYFLFKILLFLVIVVLVCKRKKRDFKKDQIKVSSHVPIEKIIIALEIKDFFVQVENKLKPGFEPLQMPNTETGLIIKTLSFVLGYRPSIKPLYSLREITQFVKGLKNVERIELMLYTSLSPEVSDAILRKLRLSEYFPPENRKYCDPKQDDMMKHAISVDKESRRVVIITPSKKDHNWEDEQYFLIQNPKGGRIKNLLKDCLRNVKTLVEENESFDVLHDELAQLKIDVEESDMSDFSDVEREIDTMKG